MNLTQMVETTLKSFRQDIPEYVGAGVVDLSTGCCSGTTRSTNNRARFSTSLAPQSPICSRDGRSARIESMWRHHHQVADGRAPLQEVLIRSAGLVLLLLHSPHEDIVTAVACRRDVNIGMLLAQARHVMREFDMN